MKAGASIPRFKRRRKEIVQALVAYFKADAPGAADMARRVVLRPEGRDDTVWKVKQDGSALITQALPGGAFVSRREDQLAGLLAAAVRTKAHRLRAIPEPALCVSARRWPNYGSLLRLICAARARTGSPIVSTSCHFARASFIRPRR